MSYVGQQPETVYGSIESRYFYALRRTDDGELFFTKIDQLDADAVVQVNNMGDPVDNYADFQQGVDFFEGRDANHDLVYKNLNFEQLRWDDRTLFYYINDEGELIVKVNRPHTYAEGVSSDG
jgi:hypothetical protein